MCPHPLILEQACSTISISFSLLMNQLDLMNPLSNRHQSRTNERVRFYAVIRERNGICSSFFYDIYAR